MNVELHQLDLRYEKLRTHKPEAERKLVGSLADDRPASAGRGRARRGARAVRAGGWLQARAGAAPARAGSGRRHVLGSERGGGARAGSADAHGRGRDGAGARVAVARARRAGSRCRWRISGRRFARSASWVSRRLALVEELPEAIQDARAARRAAGPRGHEIPGPLGARQRRRLCAPGGGHCRQGAHQSRGRPALRRLARGPARDPRARPDGAAALPESPARRRRRSRTTRAAR